MYLPSAPSHREHLRKATQGEDDYEFIEGAFREIGIQMSSQPSEASEYGSLPPRGRAYFVGLRDRLSGDARVQGAVAFTGLLTIPQLPMEDFFGDGFLEARADTVLYSTALRIVA